MTQNAIKMMDLALEGYLSLTFLLLICLIPVIEKMEKTIFSWLEKKIRRLKNPDPDRPPGPSPVPASGLGGGLWVGLAVLGVGVVSVIWYLYRKRSLVEDLDDVIPDPPCSIRAGDPSGDLYGRGRGAYRRDVF